MTEHDGLLNPDDKLYSNLALKTLNFLQQEYIVLPDQANAANNQWLKDLFETDSKEIELTRLDIVNEDPTKNAKLQKIVLYNA